MENVTTLAARALELVKQTAAGPWKRSEKLPKTVQGVNNRVVGSMDTTANADFVVYAHAAIPLLAKAVIDLSAQVARLKHESAVVASDTPVATSKPVRTAFKEREKGE